MCIYLTSSAGASGTTPLAGYGVTGGNQISSGGMTQGAGVVGNATTQGAGVLGSATTQTIMVQSGATAQGATMTSGVIVQGVTTYQGVTTAQSDMTAQGAMTGATAEGAISTQGVTVQISTTSESVTVQASSTAQPSTMQRTPENPNNLPQAGGMIENDALASNVVGGVSSNDGNSTGLNDVSNGFTVVTNSPTTTSFGSQGTTINIINSPGSNNVSGMPNITATPTPSVTRCRTISSSTSSIVTTTGATVNLPSTKPRCKSSGSSPPFPSFHFHGTECHWGAGMEWHYNRGSYQYHW